MMKKKMIMVEKKKKRRRRGNFVRKNRKPNNEQGCSDDKALEHSRLKNKSLFTGKVTVRPPTASHLLSSALRRIVSD